MMIAACLLAGLPLPALGQPRQQAGYAEAEAAGAQGMGARSRSLGSLLPFSATHASWLVVRCALVTSLQLYHDMHARSLRMVTAQASLFSAEQSVRAHLLSGTTPAPAKWCPCRLRSPVGNGAAAVDAAAFVPGNCGGGDGPNGCPRCVAGFTATAPRVRACVRCMRMCAELLLVRVDPH